MNQMKSVSAELVLDYDSEGNLCSQYVNVKSASHIQAIKEAQARGEHIKMIPILKDEVGRWWELINQKEWIRYMPRQDFLQTYRD